MKRHKEVENKRIVSTLSRLLKKSLDKTEDFRERVNFLTVINNLNDKNAKFLCLVCTSEIQDVGSAICERCLTVFHGDCLKNHKCKKRSK